MKDKLKLSILWIFSFLVIIFMMTFTAHASNSSNLPYYVDYYRSSYFNSNPEDILYYNINLICDLRWVGEPYQYNNTYRVALYYVNFGSNTYELKNHALNTVIDYNLFNFTYDYVIFYNVNYILFELGQDGNFHQVGSNYSDGVASSVALMGKGSGYKNNFGWSSNIPHSLKPGTVLYYNNDSSKPIFVNGTPSISVDKGHAMPPDNFDNPVYPNNHVPPHNVPPHYTINNYTWTNPPTTDFSTIENGLDSLGDLIKWLSNNISGEFSNLIDNLKGLFEYIGDTLNYYGDLIIKNIQNGINTFYYNMKSLVEDIGDNISYLVQPLDQETVYITFENTSINTDLTDIQTNFNSFFGQFSNISEPSTYKIPIHFENISMFSGVGVQYLDLGWLDSVKTLLRAFLWCVTTYGLIAGIFDAIPNYINGGGGEDD